MLQLIRLRVIQSCRFRTCENKSLPLFESVCYDATLAVVVRVFSSARCAAVTRYIFRSLVIFSHQVCATCLESLLYFDL